MPEPSSPQPPQRERERRWTIMVVPHGTDAPRSWSVSERAVRGAKWGAGILGAVLVIGMLTIGVQLRRMASQPAMAATPGASAKGAVEGGEVAVLRARVDSINQALDTIHDANARIGAAAGVNPARADSVARYLSARAESLQAASQRVAERYGSLADSATKAARKGKRLR